VVSLAEGQGPKRSPDFAVRELVVSPRKRTDESSPALQCWDHRKIGKPKPVKRATDMECGDLSPLFKCNSKPSAIRFTD
jgi:hypothetical protein